MTTPQQPPVDPDAVAEVAPGQGPEPGSAYYGGSEIHRDGAGESAPAEGQQDLTTEAGTFQDLPVSPDEQVE
ncbi:MAG: hypothetical protein K0R87_2273 [Pseudonocardia sp.]|jgi:hypothetical protein|nr:hypothetical protein [Pseudonocardia sp.]